MSERIDQRFSDDEKTLFMGYGMQFALVADNVTSKFNIGIARELFAQSRDIVGQLAQAPQPERRDAVAAFDENSTIVAIVLLHVVDRRPTAFVATAS